MLLGVAFVDSPEFEPHVAVSMFLAKVGEGTCVVIKDCWEVRV